MAHNDKDSLNEEITKAIIELDNIDAVEPLRSEERRGSTAL